MDYETMAYAQKATLDARMGGSIKGFAGIDVATDAPKQESSFEAMGRAIETMNAVCDRVGQLAIRLVGPVPQNANGTEAHPPTVPFVFPALGQAAGDMQRRAMVALHDLERINRELP